MLVNALHGSIIAAKVNLPGTSPGASSNALHDPIIAANVNLSGTSPGHPVTLCMALNNYQRKSPPNKPVAY
jgi:hypothetical protein